MLKEPEKILKRRFSGRILESGLLILAVALGVGASASGFAILTSTRAYSRNILSSPAYREIVVSTRDKADNMPLPVSERPVIERALLTSSDLKASEIIPHIAYSYVSNETRLRFFNQRDLSRIRNPETDFPAPPGAETSPGPSSEPSATNGQIGSVGASPPSGTPNPEAFMEQLASAASDPDVQIAPVDEIRGYEVTPEFFQAWGLTAAYGSLFSDSEALGAGSSIILGSLAAGVIAGREENSGDLIGKKLMTLQGYKTIVGILNPAGKSDFDQDFFAPFQEGPGGTGAGGRGIRMPAWNTQLRFAVSDPAYLQNASVLLQEWFAGEFGEGQVIVTNPREEAVQIAARNTGLSLLILFLSLAGLFIASVNVSNILMGRAIRMKKHVGILMALGASRKNILSLFASEAAAVSLSGGILGGLFSIPLTGTMKTALDIGKTSWIYLLIGVFSAVFITLVFSIVPIVQSAGADPAQAMREI